MEYSSYTAEHLYNKHRVLSNVHRMLLSYMMGTNINTNLNEFCKFLDPVLVFFPLFPGLISSYFENLQREAMKTSKTSSRTKLILICLLNSVHWSDISWFTNTINLVKNLKILSMSTNTYNIKNEMWKLAINTEEREM